MRLRRPRLTPRLRELLRLMVPGVIGAGVVQINLLIDVVIASILPEGSISFLYFADRVNQLPIGVIGVAVGTALLPLLSRQVAAGDTAGANASQNRALEAGLLLTLPAAAALVIISFPIVSVLFERGEFGADASRATAFALMAYSLGLPAYVMIKVLTPGYFARKDTRTPVKIAIIAVGVNITLNLILIWPLEHVGLALATAISAWLNAALLARGLRRRRYLRLDERLRRRLPRIVFASAVMGVGLVGGLFGLETVAEQGGGMRILSLAILIVGGVLIFAAVAHLTGAARLREVRRLLRSKAPPG